MLMSSIAVEISINNSGDKSKKQTCCLNNWIRIMQIEDVQLDYSIKKLG